jgi:D-alanyl-D-alanine endopeptidase (penicillin-binding protein 7)
MRILLTSLALAIALIGSADAKPRVTKKARSVSIPEFSAKSYLIADSAGSVLKEHDMDAILPIASISKLMVALLSTEQNLDEDLEVPVKREVQSSIPKKVTHLTRKELLTLALVKSDNLAAQVLCTNLPDCVDKMNFKAIEIGMFNTHYVEPTGLDRRNISTANDLLKLLMVAAQDPTITHLSSMPTAEISTSGKPIKIKNTNPLTNTMDTVLSKTGYTKPAGGCLVMILNTTVGQRILILLGSKNSKTRIPDMERLVKGLD